MNNSVSELIKKYRSLTFPSDHLGDCHENHTKVNILKALDESANNREVSQLLLDVLSDSSEYDLARIEAIKIVWVYVNESSHLERSLKYQVWKILASEDEDILVRQHASQNITEGFGGDSEHEIVGNLLFDNVVDLDIRHGVFSCFQYSNDKEFIANLTPRLKAHPIWSRYLEDSGGIDND